MKALSLLLALFALLLAARVAGAEDFLIGYWWGPAITRESASLIAGANFTVAQFGGKSVEEIRSQLDACQTAGLKGMILVDGDRLMSRPYSDPGFAAGIGDVVRDYGSHPALWGYFLQDEPSSQEQIRHLAEVSRQLVARDPDRVPFINLLPIQGWQPYERNVEAFCRTVNPRLLSFDKYALLGDREAPDFYANLEVIRRQARKHGVPFNYILLATPHGGYRDPSEGDLRWQAYSALAYGARGLTYFTYTTPPPGAPEYAGWGQGIVSADGQPTPKYAWVRDLNAEVKRLAPALMDLRSNAVYHTEPVPEGCAGLPDGDLILDIKGGDFVVGRFRSTSGESYLMFVNRNPRADAFATITFAEPVRLMRYDAQTGRQHPVAMRFAGDHRIWRTYFGPGEGRLVRIR